MPQPIQPRNIAILVMLTAACVLLHGYHLGVQDQAIYLPAIKKALDAALYPHDAAFFISQTQWMYTDEIIAAVTRATGAPLEVVLFIFHLTCVFLVLLALLRISRRCWSTAAGQWGAVLLAASLLSLVAAGSGVPMVDNHVHPRNPAMAAILLALPAALDRRPIALVGVLVAAVFHPISAAIGAVHLGVLAWKPRRLLPMLPLLTLPFFTPVTGDWQVVLRTYRHYYLWRWYWYEWLGLVVPLLFLFWFARRRGGAASETARRISGRIALSTTLLTVVAGAAAAVPHLEALVILQLMRAMQVAFLFFFFLIGGWLGESFAGKQALRWLLVLLPACVGMTCFQLYFYPFSAQVEWPGRAPRNQWVEAFEWIKHNTPKDAYFAFDPLYMTRPGEDWHGFRGLAERSHIADYSKDRGVTSLTPSLATEWIRQYRLVEDWRSFVREDFARLRRDHGVSWVLLENGFGPELDCPWQNARVRVCRTP
jgi:hypothetical protein